MKSMETELQKAHKETVYTVKLLTAAERFTIHLP